MKILGLVGLMVSQVLASASIHEELYLPDFNRVREPLMLEVGSFGSGNLTYIPAYLRFFRRITGNMTSTGISNGTNSTNSTSDLGPANSTHIPNGWGNAIVDYYNVVVNRYDVGNATRAMIAHGPGGFGLGFGFGRTYLETKFEITINGGFLNGTESLEIPRDELRVSWINFLARDVLPESTIAEIISNETGISWFPLSSQIFTAFSVFRSDFRGLDRFSMFHLRAYLIPSTTVTISFIGIPSCENNLLGTGRSLVVIPRPVLDGPIVDEPVIVDEDEDIDDDFEDVPEEEEVPVNVESMEVIEGADGSLLRRAVAPAIDPLGAASEQKQKKAAVSQSAK